MSRCLQKVVRLSSQLARFLTASGTPCRRVAATRIPLTKEFRIRVSSPASVVELVYPESGTYSFKLEPIFDQVRLATREIRVGSAVVTDPETKQRVDWRSMSIIHVGGTVYDEGWARVLSSTFDLAFESSDEGAVSVQRFAAGRILSLSEDAIETFVQDSESDR